MRSDETAARRFRAEDDQRISVEVTGDDGGTSQPDPKPLPPKGESTIPGAQLTVSTRELQFSKCFIIVINFFAPLMFSHEGREYFWSVLSIVGSASQHYSSEHCFVASVQLKRVCVRAES